MTRFCEGTDVSGGQSASRRCVRELARLLSVRQSGDQAKLPSIEQGRCQRRFPLKHSLFSVPARKLQPGVHLDATFPVTARSVRPDPTIRSVGGGVSVSASNEWPYLDRRAGPRPASGDRRPCPSCGDVMRFYERYVVARGNSASTQPAWVCRCGYEAYVREGES